MIDPILELGTRTLIQTGLREHFLDRLHARRQTLVFPLNVPRNIHWMVVFVWLNPVGKLVVQCRNSMRAYSSRENECCTRVRVYIKSLYNHSDTTVYTFPGFGVSRAVTWTEQTTSVHACGLHVLSHIYLASKGLEHTHIFDNDFVERLREYCVQVLHAFRCGRRTTTMTPIDLTLDDPRFNCIHLE